MRPPFAEYLVHHHRRETADDYDPDRHPDGYLALCVAENKLVSDLLIDRIRHAPPPPPPSLGYDHMVGSETFRRRLAGFMERTFIGRRIDPDHLVTLAGAGSILETLFFAIADPGDGVLVPTPSYAAFWADLGTRDALTIVPVPTTSANGFKLTPTVLDETLRSADRPIRALLFTSPSNPLGHVYTPDELEFVASWAEQHRVHLVMDEIYALSIYGDAAFTSIAQVRKSLGDHIHVIWAFSKDFAMSGLRAGVLWSENEDVLAAVEGLAYWAAVSGLTQWVLSDMISDAAWVDAYLTDMRTRLGAAHDETVRALDKLGIAQVPADAGIFLYCDFRPFLREPTWEAEQALWRRMLDEARVNLTPGAACHAVEPGWMRICFASQPTEHVLEGLDRIGNVLGD